MPFTIVSATESQTAELQSMLSRFDNEGQLLHNGRNQVRLMTCGGQTIAVKRYHRLPLLKAIIYTFFRTNKAQRAYENAQQLLRLGFNTPEPVAYAVDKRWGLIRQTFFVSARTEWEDISRQLTQTPQFDKDLATAYALFVTELHEKGVLHHDLNPTNVLFHHNQQGYQFALIDINRMEFFPQPLTKQACMENLTRFWWLTDVYRFILDRYAQQRGWTEADKEKALRIKMKHDRHWIRRKNLLSMLGHGRLKYPRNTLQKL